MTDTSDNSNNSNTPSGDDIILNKVFVGNLAFKTNFKSLKNAFATVGNVERVYVVSKNGKRLGFGFVQFTEADDAKKAIEKLNDTELDGRQIKVEHSISKKRVKRVPKKEDNNKEDKKEETTKPKRKSRNMKKRNKKVKEEQKETKANEEEKEEDKEERKKRIRVRIPLSEREESENVIFVGNLSESVTEESLEKLFKDYGGSEIIIKYSWRGKDKPKFKFAFVSVNPESRQKAIDTLNETEFEGETITLKVALKPVTKEQIDEAKEKILAKPRKPRKKRRNNKKPVTNSDEKQGEDTSSNEKQGEDTSSNEKPVEETKE